MLGPMHRLALVVLPTFAVACSELPKEPSPTASTPASATTSAAVPLARADAASEPVRSGSTMTCHTRGPRPRVDNTECFADLASCTAAAAHGGTGAGDAGATCTWVEHAVCTTVGTGDVPSGQRCFADRARCLLFQVDVSSSADSTPCTAR